MSAVVVPSASTACRLSGNACRAWVCRYKGGSRWYDATVTRVNRLDGSYDLRYADGDREDAVPRDRIKASSESSSSSPRRSGLGALGRASAGSGSDSKGPDGGAGSAGGSKRDEAPSSSGVRGYVAIDCGEWAG